MIRPIFALGHLWANLCRCSIMPSPFSAMFECLGISTLGLCAYDPSNPPNVYFSIGEAAAALIITLIIPQFLKPIYRFRLTTQSIRLTHLYFVVFLGAACVLVATILPNISIPRSSIFAYPVFWELFGGLLFLVAFFALAFALLRPARARHGAYRRFAQAAADFLAHANEQDRSDFSRDLLGNVANLIKTAGFVEYGRDWSAFFQFRHRRKIEDGSYAWSLLQFVAEPQFCETLVRRCPWDTVAMLRQISDRRLASRAAESFVREIGRQAIICPSSMMAREVGYKGFHAAPVLSQALFEDWFINRHYQPLSGLEFGDFTNVDENMIDRLSHGLQSTLATVLNAGDYWGDRSLASMSGHFQQAARDVHRQIRADRDNYGVVMGIDHGMKQLIDDTVEHLDGLNQEDYDSLYANTKDRRDFTVLDYLSEAIVEVLYSFANDFEGHEDAYWHTAIDIVDGLFGRFGDQPDGMDPLQQRVAIKFIDKVKENIDGLYPALTRVLLPVIGPYEDPANKNPNSAHSLLRKAFYAELMRFPNLYEKDPEKAGDFLPKNVRYDDKTAALVQIYLLGQEKSTNLRTLSIESVSFKAEAVRRERPADE